MSPYILKSEWNMAVIPNKGVVRPGQRLDGADFARYPSLLTEVPDDYKEPEQPLEKPHVESAPVLTEVLPAPVGGDIEIVTDPVELRQPLVEEKKSRKKKAQPLTE